MNSFFSILINGNHRAFAFPKIIQSESSQMELLADIVPYEMFEISILYDTYSDKVKSFKDINDITPFSNDITEDTFSCSIKVSFLPAINDSHDTKLVQIPRKLQSVSPTSYIIAIVRSSFHLSIYLKKRKSEEKKKRKKDWTIDPSHVTRPLHFPS